MHWYCNYTDATRLFAALQQSELQTCRLLKFHMEQMDLHDDLIRIQYMLERMRLHMNEWIVFADANVIVDNAPEIIDKSLQIEDTSQIYAAATLSFIIIYASDEMCAYVSSFLEAPAHPLCVSNINLEGIFHDPDYYTTLHHVSNTFDISEIIHCIPRHLFNVFQLNLNQYEPAHYLAKINYPRTKGKSAIVFELNNSAGFYSVFLFMCEAYLMAQRYKYDFFISHKGWPYAFENGWHDYFDSLVMFNDSDITNYDSVIRVSHLDMNPIMEDTATTLEGCNYRCEFTLNDYIRACHDIYKLKPSILKKAEDIIQSINEPYTSIFVRRGDKITSGETLYVSTAEIIRQIECDNLNVLFIQTDDYSVVEEIGELLPNARIVSTVPFLKRGSFHISLYGLNSDGKREWTEEMLVGLYICMKASVCWTDDVSNVGRFLKLMGMNTTRVYSLDSENNHYVDSERISVNPAFPTVFREIQTIV